MDMQAFLDHVEAYDPGFRSRIRGASPEAIAKLQERAGFPLPESYRGFLELMGKDTGGLHLINDMCPTDIDEILAYYEELENDGLRPGTAPPKTELELIPEGCVHFALGDSMFAEDVYLQTHEGREPSIVIGAAERIDTTFAESLEKLLYRAAFLRYVLPTKPESDVHSTGERDSNVQARACALARELGLELLPFSDDYCVAAQGEGLLVVVRPHSVQVRGDDKARVREIGARFGESLNMTRPRLD